MEQKLRIIVEADGTFSIKRQLQDLGKAGDQAAWATRNSWKAAMNDLKWQAKVALNSTRLAERARVNDARAAAAEVKRIRASELSSIKAGLKAQTAAARAAAKEQTNMARAQARAQIAERNKMRSARNDATFGLGGGFGSVLGLIGIREAVSSFVELSDAAMNTQNRLKVVTSSSQQLSAVTQRLRQVALDSRAEWDITTRTYARLAQASKLVGLSQRSNISITETLTKAISVSGATTEEAHATLIQFSQAMGSNRLSADEFRSVAEQLPILLDLLADSTGRPRTELKKMGQEGELTARVMALAILEGQKKIEEMFAKTAPTIAQSWENIRTQARFAMDEFNKTTGAAQTMVDALKWAAQNMSTVMTIVQSLGSLIGTYLVYQIGLAASAFITLGRAHPFTAIAMATAAAIPWIRKYRDEILDTLGVEKELELSKDDNAPLGYSVSVVDRKNRIITDPNTGKQVLQGDKATRDARTAKKEYSDRQQVIIRKMLDEENRVREIKRLRAMQDKFDKKDKKGRHVATFDEAVRGLEDDVSELSVSKSAREGLNQTMRISSQIQRDLTSGEAEYVQALVKSKNFIEVLEKAQEAAAEAKEKRRLQDIENIKEMNKASEESREKAITERVRQLKLENRIHSGILDGISGEDDIKDARRAVIQMQGGGRLDRDKARSALNQLEIGDSSTLKNRKAFLEEVEGLGKLHDQLDGIFGVDGMLSKGFADATANAIVFGESFSKSIHQLGQQIQAEIISTLVQGLIRMAILGAMGGTTAGGAAAQALQAIGAPKSTGGLVPGRGFAAGGFTGNIGRSDIAGYVHGGEYVINAQATQKNMPALEAINKGGKASSGIGGGLNVTFIDYAGVSLETKQLSEREVQIIARREVNKEAPRVIAGAFADQNNRASKSLRTNTTARPQR